MGKESNSNRTKPNMWTGRTQTEP